MQYVGIQTQQSRNNLRSGILLILFPCLVAVLTYLFCYLLITFTVEDDYGQYNTLAMTNQMFINLIPLYYRRCSGLVYHSLLYQFQYYQSCHRRAPA